MITVLPWRRLSYQSLGVATVLSLGAIFNAAHAIQAIDEKAICLVEAARQEHTLSIPPYLLQSIALVESGQWDSARKASFAWPWTVMAEGEGRFLPSKEAAIAEVRKLQARGVRNIDVGCMQVNLLAHAKAFASLDQAFDPGQNTAYAARFLRGLHDATQDWGKAGGYYHSQTPALAAGYRQKLVATWYKLSNGGTAPAVQVAQAPLTPSPHPQPARSGLPAPARMAALPSSVPPHPQTLHPSPARSPVPSAPSAAERAEGRQIAEAYRRARLAEYQLRKQSQGRG